MLSRRRLVKLHELLKCLKMFDLIYDVLYLLYTF
jgi:hypothetical protein